MASIGAGAALGSLSALLGWASSGELFEAKKFGIGIATGAIAGVALISLSFAAIKAAVAADPSGVALLELLVPIAISIVGTDLVRAKISAMIANRPGTTAVTTTVTPPAA